jgi:integrase|nr:MAG TPA: Integrase [Caudoviricetes sp.]
MAKRGQGEGTISKRPDGTWWARITVGRTPDGKQKRKAFYGKTRKEVQEKLTAALNDVNTGTYIEPSKMTVAQWLDIWLKEYKKNHVKLTTLANYHGEITHQIVPFIGCVKLKDLRTDVIQKWINDLAGKGLAVSTVRGAYGTLNTALKQAVNNELIAKNVAAGVKLPREEKHMARVMTMEEQKKFVAICKNEIAKGRNNHCEVFLFALATGMRIGEIMALTWKDIDFEKGEISISKTAVLVKMVDEVEQNGLKYKLIINSPKTRAGYRIIPLLDDAKQLLIEHKKRQDDNKVAKGNLYYDEGIVFTSRYGKYLISSQLRENIKRVSELAGIAPVHLHALRHTFATRGLENGIELKVMQELLGHSKISMTADLYTHVLPEIKKNSMNKLQGILL